MPKFEETETTPEAADAPAAAKNSNLWLPPGADSAEEEPQAFGEDLEEHFVVPPRLNGISTAIITAVNDFHFAMMNDSDRNEFYRQALRKVVGPDTVVLEIGAGSGLLSMIAAKEGAGRVVAVEANRHMCQVAQSNVMQNSLQDNIQVLSCLSTDMSPASLPEGRCADVLVSEILGTLMLGEGALDYIADARKRLLKPDAKIIPACGCQYASLIESADLESITAVQGWGGIDLSGFNTLQDTVSLVFTKQYGFRFSSIRSRQMAPRVTVADVDFYTCESGFVPMEQRFSMKAAHTGIIHAVLCHWEVFADRDRTLSMSTDPVDTLNNFPRDMQWGQAIQLIEDNDAPDGPKPFHVKEGEEFDLIVKTSSDSVNMQFLVERK